MRVKAKQQKILKTIVVVIVKYFILLLWSCPKRWLSQSAALSDVAQSYQAGGPLLPLLIYWVISRGIFLQERSSIVCAGPKSIPHYGVSRREMALRGKEKREIASIPSSRFWRCRQGGSYGEAAEREEVSEERRWLREGEKKSPAENVTQSGGREEEAVWGQMRGRNSCNTSSMFLWMLVWVCFF